MRAVSATVLGVSALLCLSTGCGSTSAAEPDSRPLGEATPAHHTEDGFRNPGYPPHRASPGIRIGLPFLWRRIGRTLTWDGNGAPDRVVTDFPALEEAADQGHATVTWIGHSTLLIRVDGVTLLTDPTWSSTASPLPVGPRRYSPPAFPMDKLPAIDFVVVSHNHYDHLDLGSLKRLAAKGTRFLVPLGNGGLLKDAGIGPVTELDWWESIELGDVRVHALPARHWSRRGLFDLDRALWAGWMVEGKTRRFYFAGDTAPFDGFAEIAERFGPIDLAAIPIGAYAPAEMMAPSHMTPEEAVQALVDLKAKTGLAVHFGTFDLSDEPIEEPPLRFRRASVQRGRDDWVFAIGETRRW